MLNRNQVVNFATFAVMCGRERLATAAVLVAIVVSLLGACVVITETADQPPHHKHIVIA